MTKWIAALVLVILLLVAGGLFYLYQSLDGIVKAAIENYGSRAVGTAVTVQGVQISLRDGEGVITGLKVANPEGFDGPTALETGLIRIRVDGAAIRQRPLRVTQISVESAAINYQPRRGGGNLEVLKRNIESYVSALKKGGAKADSEGQPKLVIQDLTVREASVDLQIPVFKIRRTLKLPEIRLANLGESGSGIPPGEVARIIIDGILRQVLQSTRSDLKDALKLGGEGLKDVERGIEDIFRRGDRPPRQ